MVEINAAYVRNQIAKLVFLDAVGDGVQQVFPNTPVGPDVIGDCCDLLGGRPPGAPSPDLFEASCLYLFNIHIWRHLINNGCSQEPNFPSPDLWVPSGLNLTPADLERYNDPDSDFPTTIPPYLDFYGCPIEIWRVIPYSDDDPVWPRNYDFVPVGPKLPGDRTNRKAKLNEILECFRRFYMEASRHYRESEDRFPLSFDPGCCSKGNFQKMLMMTRLFSCLAAITRGREGPPSTTNGGEPLFSDKLLKKMQDCIACIERNCFAVG